MEPKSSGHYSFMEERLIWCGFTKVSQELIPGAHTHRDSINGIYMYVLLASFKPFSTVASLLALSLGLLTCGISFGPNLLDVHHLMSSSVLTSIFSLLSDQCSRLLVWTQDFLLSMLSNVLSKLSGLCFCGLSRLTGHPGQLLTQRPLSSGFSSSFTVTRASVGAASPACFLKPLLGFKPVLLVLQMVQPVERGSGGGGHVIFFSTLVPSVFDFNLLEEPSAGGEELLLQSSVTSTETVGLSWSDIDIGYWSDISQKTNIGWYRTSSTNW